MRRRTVRVPILLIALQLYSLCPIQYGLRAFLCIKPTLRINQRLAQVKYGLWLGVVRHLRPIDFMHRGRNYERKAYVQADPKADVPCDTANAGDVTAFWETALSHRGVEELRANRGRPPNAETDRKEQIALRLGTDVLAWYRSLGTGWQTRMNAGLKAYRDATV